MAVVLVHSLRYTTKFGSHDWKNIGMFVQRCVHLSTLNMGYMLSRVDTFLRNAYNSTGLNENQAIVRRDNNEVEDLPSIRGTHRLTVPIVMYCNFL